MGSPLDTGFRLDEWEVHPKLGLIRNQDGDMHLEYKVMAVLVLLAENVDETVTKDTLLEVVWEGTCVTEDVISRSISQLRRCFNDDAHNPKFIQTVPKLGYRLIVPVTSLSDQKTAAALASKHWIFTTVIVSLLIIIGAAGFWMYDINHVPADAGKNGLSSAVTAPNQGVVAIAVIPFQDIAEDRDNSYFSDGLSDELIIALGKLKGLKVVSRTTSFSIKKLGKGTRELGRLLNVDAVLEGSVRKHGDKIQVSAQLSDTETGYQIWSQVYESQLEDVFDLHHTLSTAIVDQLRSEIDSRLDPDVRPERPSTENFEAYQLFLRGRHQWKKRGESALRKSIEFYQQALNLDPAFAKAYLALANSYALLPIYSNEAQEPLFRKALAALDKARALDWSLEGDAAITQAFILFRQWQWQAAEKQFQKALELRPNNATLHNWYSSFNSSVNNANRALTHAKRARELDTVSPVINERLSIAYLWMDDNVQAAKHYQIAKELGYLGRQGAGSYLLWLLRHGRYQEVGQILKQRTQAQELGRDWVDPFIDTLQTGGNREETAQILMDAYQQGHISPRRLFIMWVVLGEQGQAFAMLPDFKAKKNEFDVEFLFSREADAFRKDPRFADALALLGLDSYWNHHGWPESAR